MGRLMARPRNRTRIMNSREETSIIAARVGVGERIGEAELSPLPPPAFALVVHRRSACGQGFSGSGVASQIFTVPSKEALARRLLSVLNSTLTKVSLPLSVSISSPVSASQILILL